MEAGSQAGGEPRYPVEYSVDYPDRDLNRLTTALRLIWVIPIAILLATLSGEHTGGYEYGQYWHFGAALGGGLFLGPLPLGQPGARVSVHPRHRRVPPVPAGAMSELALLQVVEQQPEG
jgi:hypothetical protein